MRSKVTIQRGIAARECGVQETGANMRQISLGLLLGSLPFLLGGITEGQTAKSPGSRASIDQAAPAKVETATLALG
jgi:hypothetical protein